MDGSNANRAASHHKLKLLLGSTSMAALLIGGGAPAAAACYTGPFANPGGYTNSGAISCIVVSNTSFTGNVVNAGTITAPATGISIVSNSTITGSVSNSGTINAAGMGIFVDNSLVTNGIINAAGATIAGAQFSGIRINIVSVFSGGITNSGTISGGGGAFGGIVISSVSTFTGGISNGGMISSSFAGTASGFEAGIFLDEVASFSGGISNSGTITAAKSNGIYVIGGVTFNGGISNSGLISAAGNGVIVADEGIVSGGVGNSGTISAGYNGIAVEYDSSFAGISNSSGGTITAGNDGIYVGGISLFSSGVTNAGIISAANVGIQVGMQTSANGSGISTFSGNISNSGTISAGVVGIVVESISTFSGNISNSGSISAGVDGAGMVVDRVSNFSGSIVNASTGTISGAAFGIIVENVSTFTGNVSNAGLISAGLDAGIIFDNVSTFTGNVFNSGTIAAATGINLRNSTINGAIFDTGTILATSHGILIDSASAIVSATQGIDIAGPTFTGGITNFGTISGGGRAIGLLNVSLFTGGISNDGAIVGRSEAIDILLVSNFSGGITNAGTIAAGSGQGLFLSAISTFSGDISNSGTIAGHTGIAIESNVTFAGGAALVNSGNITGTGGTAIDAVAATSAVTIDQVGGTISGKILLSQNADVLNVSGGVINGNIVGQGTSDTLNFALGSGTFTYDAAYGFLDINQVNINSGTVVLNGVNNATNVDVNGGMLAGSGTLDPLTVTIHSGATFAPGTPGVPGTSMTITGNLAFQSGALYVVYLNSAGSTFANVSGSASLAGTVTANFAPSGSLQKRYTLLTAGGGLGGTAFSGLTTVNLPAGATDSLSYDADDVYLNVTAPFSNFTGLTVNQRDVANALTNYFNANGSIPARFFGLTPGALTQIDGEDGTGAERGAFELTNEFLGLMLDPFVYGRGGDQNTGGGALGFAPDQQTSLPPDVALAYAGALKAPPQTFAQRWSTWASGFGGSATTNGDPAVIGSMNVTTSTYGYAAGLDYHYSPDTVFGFSLAGGGTSWNLAQGLGTGRSDAFLAGVYGVTHAGPWYLGGALAFANNWFSTSRTPLGDQLTASFQGQSYAARLEGGYRLAMPYSHATAGFTPYAAIQAQNFHTPSYSETDLTGGGFGLSYNAMNGTDTRSELGGRFDDPTAINNMPLVLRAKVAWAHDWVSNPALNASFESLPGAGFTVFGAPIPHDTALTSAGAQLFFTPNWSLIGKFDGEFANGYELYAGSGTLRYTW